MYKYTLHVQVHTSITNDYICTYHINRYYVSTLETLETDRSSKRVRESTSEQRLRALRVTGLVVPRKYSRTTSRVQLSRQLD